MSAEVLNVPSAISAISSASFHCRSSSWTSARSSTAISRASPRSGRRPRRVLRLLPTAAREIEIREALPQDLGGLDAGQLGSLAAAIRAAHEYGHVCVPIGDDACVLHVPSTELHHRSAARADRRLGQQY